MGTRLLVLVNIHQLGINIGFTRIARWCGLGPKKESEEDMSGTEVIGLILLVAYFAVIVGLLGLTLYGIYLGFCASIILGIIMIFLEPSGLVVGAVYVFFGKDLAAMLIQWLCN